LFGRQIGAGARLLDDAKQLPHARIVGGSGPAGGKCSGARAEEGVKKSGYSQLRLAAGTDSTQVAALRLWQSPIFSRVPVPVRAAFRSEYLLHFCGGYGV
jgi:hypothetical protein